MNIENIHPSWGSKITVDNPNEILEVPDNFWRDLMYSRKFLCFKQVNWSKIDYVNFLNRFGRTWNAQDYFGSKEAFAPVSVKDKVFFIAPISNKISHKLRMLAMPYHADIPNNERNPFPVRSLWMTSNPNPDSGFTGFLNIEDGIDRLPDNLKEQLDRIQIVQQDWHNEGHSVKTFPFVKVHPVTGGKSLRLNWYNNKEHNVTHAWIQKVLLDGVEVEPYTVLKPYIDFLESQPDMVYVHRWDNYDILIYDNYPFVHNRTELIFDPELERKFERANVDHLNDADWETHKQTTYGYFK